MAATEDEAPYLQALIEYAERDPARLHVPGHKGGPGADPQLREAIGERAVSLDIPALTYGIDVGPDPTPFEEAQRLAAQAWGAQRAWFLVNGASQGNLAAGLALAHRGNEVVVQRNAHSSAVDALVLSGLRPTFVAPELDPELGIAHCLLPSTLDAALTQTPGAVGAWVVSPTYFGAVADVRALAEVAHAHGVPLIVDEAWGAHMAFHDELPAHALSLGADLVISSTHKIVGSLTQSAMLHLGARGAELIGEEAVDRAVTLTESTSPSSLLTASLDAARRFAVMHGEELLAHTMQTLTETRAQIRAIDGLDVLDERMAGRAACSPTTRCASPSTYEASRRRAMSSRRYCARSATSTWSYMGRTSSSRSSAWASLHSPRARGSSAPCARPPSVSGSILPARARASPRRRRGVSLR